MTDEAITSTPHGGGGGDGVQTVAPADISLVALQHALSVTKWWDHCGHIESADGWTTPQLAAAILARLTEDAA